MTRTRAGKCRMSVQIARLPVILREPHDHGGSPMRSAIYAHVSTFDQEPESQLAEIRRYVAARGWTAVEYVDRGVSVILAGTPLVDRTTHRRMRVGGVGRVPRTSRP